MLDMNRINNDKAFKMIRTQARGNPEPNSPKLAKSQFLGMQKKRFTELPKDP